MPIDAQCHGGRVGVTGSDGCPLRSSVEGEDKLSQDTERKVTWWKQVVRENVLDGGDFQLIQPVRIMKTTF